MKALLLVGAVTAGALALGAGSVVAGHDTSTLVSPPEAVVEQFVRKLAAARYDVARAHLADDSPAARERIRTARETLRARAGAINQVEGKPGVIEGERATATAVVTTERAGEIPMELRVDPPRRLMADHRFLYPVKSGETKVGAPDRIRTCGPQLRRLVLYPAELRARGCAIADL